MAPEGVRSAPGSGIGPFYWPSTTSWSRPMRLFGPCSEIFPEESEVRAISRGRFGARVTLPLPCPGPLKRAYLQPEREIVTYIVTITYDAKCPLCATTARLLAGTPSPCMFDHAYPLCGSGSPTLLPATTQTSPNHCQATTYTTHGGVCQGVRFCREIGGGDR